MPLTYALEGEVSGGDVSTVITSLTNGISAAQVATILAAGVAACTGIVLLYFGVRKAMKMFMGALYKGKIKL